MSYTPKHNYRRKDSLSPGDPDKIIYGSDLSDDFEAIADAVSLLNQIDIDGDGEINIPPELIEGLGGILDGKADQDDLDAEVAARIAGDKVLQDKIDAIDPDGDSTIEWDEIDGKPTEFPPESHSHEIDDVNGLQDALDAAGGTPAWDDVTGRPTEFPPEAHTHDQSEVDGLETRLETIEDSITSGGGFVDAPDDGKLYGRQSEAWAEVVIPDAADPDWTDIQNKPTEFPPEDHTHDYLTEAPDDGNQYVRQSKAWAEITIPDVDSPDYTLPVALRSGDVQLPLTVDGAKLAVMTRGGELELPLAA